MKLIFLRDTMKEGFTYPNNINLSLIDIVLIDALLGNY